MLPAALVIAFLVFDATMPFVVARLPDVVAVLMFANGVVIAELWVLAVWTALGLSPWIGRVAISLALSVAAVGVFEHGLIYITTWGFTPGIRQVFLAPIELISLACPLLVMRVWRGWRLVSDRNIPVRGDRRFSLRHLFLAIALVAVAVPFAQLGVAELFRPDLRQVILIRTCLGCLFLSLLAVIPLTWLCLRVRLRRAVSWLVVLAATTNGVAIALMCRYWSGRQLNEGIAGLAFCDAVPLAFAGTLLLLRRVGRIELASSAATV